MYDTSIEEKIARRLISLGHTLATAESCAGGLIAHRLTNLSGSSQYFLGGIVAYSNDAKVRFLGVSNETLRQHGAVSPQTAAEMAEGALERFQSHYAVSVTGIAGPTGGTPEKPVGLVYMAVSGKSGTVVARHFFQGNRDEIKSATAQTVLEQLLEYIS